MPWSATILTLFPEMFPGPLGTSLCGKALATGLWSLEVKDIREHGIGKHRTVDDSPSGGGPGMVMRPDVAAAAVIKGANTVMFDEKGILGILDQCCANFTFPMLDNGYVYLAACRLSLHRSAANWAMVIEVFGFSPRAGLPDTSVLTFAQALHDRDPAEKYIAQEAYQAYLAKNPHNEFRSTFPIEEGSWQDAEDLELLSRDAREFVLRGVSHSTPELSAYAQFGMSLVECDRARTFEFCRWLAAVERDAVLATDAERRMSLGPDLRQILLLDEWHHPDLCAGEVASDSETFRQLARVLATGDVSQYAPSCKPNTHWINWPDGGTL